MVSKIQSQFQLEKHTLEGDEIQIDTAGYQNKLTTKL